MTFDKLLLRRIDTLNRPAFRIVTWFVINTYPRHTALKSAVVTMETDHLANTRELVWSTNAVLTKLSSAVRIPFLLLDYSTDTVSIP